MTNSDEKIIMAEGKYLRLVKEGTWEYVERVNVTGIVVMVPLLENEKLILIDQYRLPLKKRVIEFPAGLVGDEAGKELEDLEGAAQRELEEEIGYRAGKLTLMMEGPPTAGLCSEIMSFYLATELQKTGDGGGVAEEDIRIHVLPLDNLDAWLSARKQEGFLIDPKLYAGIYLAKQAIRT